LESNNGFCVTVNMTLFFVIGRCIDCIFSFRAEIIWRVKRYIV